MLAVNYTKLRENMREYFDAVADSFEPMIVTRKQSNMVIMSQDYYDSLMETIHLISSRSNYTHLMKSIEQYHASALIAHELIEVDDDKLD